MDEWADKMCWNAYSLICCVDHNGWNYCISTGYKTEKPVSKKKNRIRVGICEERPVGVVRGKIDTCKR